MFHVKHFEKLAEFAKQNQIKYGGREQKQFEDLCSLLVEENKIMNLTAIEDPEEMYEIGFDEYLYGDGVCLIEWASRVEELIPDDAVRITIEKVPEKGLSYRKITIE